MAVRRQYVSACLDVGAACVDGLDSQLLTAWPNLQFSAAGVEKCRAAPSHVHPPSVRRSGSTDFIMTRGSESADSRLRLIQDRPQSSVLRRFGERAHEIHGKPGRSLRGWKAADGWKTATSEALDELVRLDRACTETVGRGGGKQGTGDE